MLTQIYHEIWLLAHPDRTEEWLKQRLCDGFHIHHVDGDHNNNDPKNLILIEGVDHLRLHGMHLKDGIKAWRSKPQKPKPDIGLPPQKEEVVNHPDEIDDFLSSKTWNGLTSNEATAILCQEFNIQWTMAKRRLKNHLRTL